MHRRIAGQAALGLLAAALAVMGSWILFTTLMIYDDEGYVLISLRNYSAQGALYDVVYSQYGPFFYLFYDALHQALHFPWDHTASRWITLLHWLGIAGFSAALVHRAGRSITATAVTLVGVFEVLWVMSREPMHPGGPAALMAALAAWWGARRDPAEFPLTAAGIGALGAATVFTKINVGVFLVAATASWLAVNTSAPRPRRWLARGMFIALAILPLALMKNLLAQSWVQVFAVVATVGTVSCLMVAHKVSRPRASLRVWSGFAAGGLITALLIVMGARLAGTSWAGLWHGVVLAPLKHPGVYFFAFNWRPGTLAVTALATALLAWAARRPDDPRPAHLIAIARLLAALGMAVSALDLWDVSLAAFCLTYGLPLAALCAWPLTTTVEAQAAARVRVWLALVFSLQCLHAYPVAGSQLNWGAFLWVPLLVLAAQEAGARLLGPGSRRAGTWATIGLAVAVVFLLGRGGWANRQAGEPLALPGAEDLIVPDHTVFGTRIVANNARRHTDTLFSLPGTFSFNLWSGVPPPTAANVTHWFALLDAEQQAEIIAVLAADPRAGIVIQRDSLGYIIDHDFVPSGPLVDHILRSYQRVLAVDGFTLWLKTGRSIAAVDTARWEPAVPPDQGGVYRLAIESPSAPITEIRIAAITGAKRTPLVVLGPDDNVELALAPLAINGTVTGAAIPWMWDTAPPSAAITSELVELTVTTALTPPYNPDRLLIELFDPAGRRIAAVRVVNEP